MDNIRTIYADLPNTIGGYTVVTDDFYTIVLNQNRNYESNMKTYYHELFHIQNNDFEKDDSAGLIELYAHSIWLSELIISFEIFLFKFSTKVV